jgi:hypothetical protein
MSKLTDSARRKIEGLKVNYMLLGKLSEADATRKAIQEVKAEEATKPKAQPSTSPKVSHPVSAETKRDADFVRNALMQDFPIELIEDLADMSDEDLRRFAEKSGIE